MLFAVADPSSSRLENAVADLLLSHGLTISDRDGICAIAPTGEHYIVLTAYGEKAEGKLLTGLRHSRESAAEAYLAALKVYADGKAGKVYWRHRPTVEHWSGGWNVYSRLLISAEPIIDNAPQVA